MKILCQPSVTPTKEAIQMDQHSYEPVVPRLFALCLGEGDENQPLDPADAVMWGMAFPDDAFLVSVEDTTRAHCQSPQSARDLFSVCYAEPLRVAWA
jgi:hypothetical protein